MKDKLKSILVLTITGFVCSILLYLAFTYIGGNL